ncbi:MAG: Putative oxidoreductase component of anaerobic dehydrogenases Chaperone protein TorD [uncultured Sulfurovum sp.]|uniref:Oxidoreductase component of anaerobic dehydrogenases Chaperone protein TorD n=1 Tax=uncultured Sulfurovum sp. TaxID=269237 RepID=A0A6S6SBX5_9BACT|nr:MAG: Putative oxidoreductase component of anaerobic dehydrogenases Chaperone protein TorD [uncultured Sulfurovum sp.]
MTVTLEEIENRISLYALVSRLMITEVDAEFIKSIESNEDILNLFPNYKAWGKRKEFSNNILKECYLDVDFTNLSLLHLVPYESFYTRNDQMIESGGENPILEIYDTLDFQVSLEEARVVSPDHIGVELEFMHVLCNAMKKAYEADDKVAIEEFLLVQRGFLKDHLLNWTPLYLINMKKESRTPLYHDGAELTLEFMLSDYEYINEQLNLK